MLKAAPEICRNMIRNLGRCCDDRHGFKAVLKQPKHNGSKVQASNIAALSSPLVCLSLESDSHSTEGPAATEEGTCAGLRVAKIGRDGASCFVIPVGVAV